MARRSTPGASKSATPDLLDYAEARQRAEPKTWTVGSLTHAIKGQLEQRYADVWVEGEVSNFRGAHRSGHMYFALKDPDAVVSVVMFRREAQAMRFRLQEGMAVLAHGRVSVYAPRGNYQLILDRIEPQGVGALMQAFEELKARLDREGLFAAERKRPLPRMPRRIGIVTSATGAAVRDMLKVIRRRAPRASVLLCPTNVQGQGAGAEVARALERVAAQPEVDVVIAGRGGGSIEDLWAFNEEAVARAIHACPVPVISAVGHEVDFTIADFVADVRAATPSHAGELVVPVVAEVQEALQQTELRLARALRSRLDTNRRRLLELERQLVDPRRRLSDARLRLDDLENRLLRLAERRVQRDRARLDALTGGLHRRDPSHQIAEARTRLLALERQLQSAARRQVEQARGRFGVAMAALDAHSPLAVLGRGYALGFKLPERTLLRSHTQVEAGDSIELRLHQGRVRAEVQESAES